MHSGKIAFLNFKGIKKVLTKIIPYIKMFPNQIHLVKIKNEIAEVSQTWTLLLDDLNLDLDTLLVGMKGKVEAMTLSLEMEDDTLEKLWEP